MAHNVLIPDLTEAISARLVAQWEAWKNQDTASNNAIIADDFNSFWPDGSRAILVAFGALAGGRISAPRHTLPCFRRCSHQISDAHRTVGSDLQMMPRFPWTSAP